MRAGTIWKWIPAPLWAWRCFQVRKQGKFLSLLGAQSSGWSDFASTTTTNAYIHLACTTSHDAVTEKWWLTSDGVVTLHNVTYHTIVAWGVTLPIMPLSAHSECQWSSRSQGPFQFPATLSFWDIYMQSMGCATKQRLLPCLSTVINVISPLQSLQKMPSYGGAIKLLANIIPFTQKCVHVNARCEQGRAVQMQRSSIQWHKLLVHNANLWCCVHLWLTSASAGRDGIFESVIVPPSPGQNCCSD